MTDGERVIAFFGSAGLFCWDMNGKELWRRDLGPHAHEWSYAASPVLHGDVCVLYFGPGLNARLMGLNKASGKTLWQARLDDAPHSFPISFKAGTTQYVAVVTGGGTPHDIIYRGFTPEFKTPLRQRTLWVFKLAGK